MRYLASAMLVVVAVIHLLPVSGVLGSERLAALYGLPFNEPNLAILMRHRAVLFGLLAQVLGQRPLQLADAWAELEAAQALIRLEEAQQALVEAEDNAPALAKSQRYKS